VHGDDPQLERGKPAPDVFLLAAGRLGVAAADCWAFEDSPAGVAAAQAAGCRVHVLPPPHLDDDALARSYPGEHTRIQNLHQVIRALEAAQ
jgi:beta-phosphoglucomutase-like phosphatase (HAD superfamily)